MSDRFDGYGQPGSLKALLRWAHTQYTMETPNLEHAVAEVGIDGDPLMRAAARIYLSLSGPKHEAETPDNWSRIAGRIDDDGFYRTPLRRALETLPRERRLLLRDLIPEELNQSDVARLHGIPAWCEGDVFYRSLAMLWGRYLERPMPKPSWTDRSESQQLAESA